jgi:hypothetical protein
MTDRYCGLRNAAWAVRNSRAGAPFNPLALNLVLSEAVGLTEEGELLYDLLQAFAELVTYAVVPRSCEGLFYVASGAFLNGE